MITRIRNRLARAIEVKQHSQQYKEITVQAHPIQKTDSTTKMLAPYFDIRPLINEYAANHVVYTAVNKLARTAATAEFMITSKPDGMKKSINHHLLNLIGPYGKPNSDQDSFEFWEKHFQSLALTGNSYWYWSNDGIHGPPTEVHLLEPEAMKIKPGRNKTIESYQYWDQGQQIKISTNQITHFRRPSPFSRYYGLSPLIAQFQIVSNDNLMLKWNKDFFDDNLGIPSGILIVPEDTSDEEIKRIKAEFIAQHGEERRVAVVKSDGNALWLEAGLKRQEADFEKGRESNRKSILEASDIPLGIMAETSTEAHAIVSERRFMETIRVEQIRTMRKLNVDGLDFWPGQNTWQADFEDLRRYAVDWRREAERRRVDQAILTTDEMRMREYKLPPIKGPTVNQEAKEKNE